MIYPSVEPNVWSPSTAVRGTRVGDDRLRDEADLPPRFPPLSTLAYAI